jgi:antitoxin YefM
MGPLDKAESDYLSGMTGATGPAQRAGLPAASEETKMGTGRLFATVLTHNLYRITVQVMKTLSYSEARENLASVIEEVLSTREQIVIQRRGYEAVAMIPADELSGLIETAHLLRSPKNAKRLLEALLRSYRGGGEEMHLDEISRAVGLHTDR